MDEPRILASVTLFEHPLVRILADTLEYGGRKRKYFYLASPIDSVATVGVTAENEILLTRQYRHPIRRVIYDLPAGRVNPGEALLAAARREFEEETGFYPEHIQPLGIYNQFPGALNATTHLFFARDLRPTQQHLDEGEILEMHAVPLTQLLDWITSAELVDGSLQLGVLLALHKGLLHP